MRTRRRRERRSPRRGRKSWLARRVRPRRVRENNASAIVPTSIAARPCCRRGTEGNGNRPISARTASPLRSGFGRPSALPSAGTAGAAQEPWVPPLALPAHHGGDAKTITQTAGVSAGRRAQLLSVSCGWRHTAVVIHCSSFCFGAAPIWREASWPPLKIISVGIDWMPYLAAVCGFSSTLSLTIFTLPLSVPAISSRAGAIIRQGPHHSAQKSTTTGPVAFNTSDSKVASETLPTAMGPTSFLLVEAKRLAWEAEAMDALGQRQGGFTGR